MKRRKKLKNTSETRICLTYSRLLYRFWEYLNWLSFGPSNPGTQAISSNALEFINLLKASARTQSEYSRTSHTSVTREDFLCSSATPLKKTEDSVIHFVQNEMATGQVSIIISARNPTTLAKTYTNVRSFKPNIHNVFLMRGQILLKIGLDICLKYFLCQVQKGFSAAIFSLC